MNREIKFRAWDTKAKTWIEPFTLVNIELNGTIIHIDYSKPEGYQRLIREDIKLCQYTGLKDKNGKEIWEGDIVTSKTKNRVETEKISDIRKDYEWLNHAHEYVEVIGDIYSNPELLT